MKQKLLDSISKMIPDGNRLDLPQDEHFSNYAEVKKALITAGGKYKKCGFEFAEDAALIKKRLLGGEAINDKKKFQFYATPPHLASRLIGLSGLTDDCRVLEPSAGQGAIANMAKAAGKECVVVELMPENCTALKRQGYDVLEGCFLSLSPSDIGMFDKIIANPPFTKNQDIDHIRHMFCFLKPGGKLVSIASKSWTFGGQKKQSEFRSWLDNVGAVVTDIPAGEFKESGTSVASVIIEISKALA